MLRRGSFTSPAVKVMLFQASAENSEPVCDTQMRDEQAERGERRQPRHDLDRAARRPEVAEVVGDRGVVPAEQHADQDQAEQRAGLGRGEDVLDDLAVFEARACWSTSAARSSRCRPAASSTATARSRWRGGSAESGSGRRQSTAPARRSSARSRPRRRRWCRSGSRGTASSRREIPTAARTPRAGRRTARRRAASSPPARRRTARRPPSGCR